MYRKLPQKWSVLIRNFQAEYDINYNKTHILVHVATTRCKNNNRNFGLINVFDLLSLRVSLLRLLVAVQIVPSPCNINIYFIVIVPG